jgi:cobalamin biosynthesis protein CbiG
MYKHAHFRKTAMLHKIAEQALNEAEDLENLPVEAFGDGGDDDAEAEALIEALAEADIDEEALASILAEDDDVDESALIEALSEM